MFELKRTDELVRIASAGGGFSINAGLRQTSDLITIARAGSIHGAPLVFRGLNLRTTDEIVSIAQAGKGCVSFEEKLEEK